MYTWKKRHLPELWLDRPDVMMRFCDASLRRVIPGTGEMSPEDGDGELAAVMRLQRAEPIWLLAIDVRWLWFSRSPARDRRRLDWRETTMRLELQLVGRVAELDPVCKAPLRSSRSRATCWAWDHASSHSASRAET